MIAVIDYGRGNLFSLGQALRHLGAEFDITDDPKRIREAERVILPGVGAFGDAMDGLRRRNLIEPTVEAAEGGTPLLGICVGMQMLATIGEEFGTHDGLNLIPGVVKRLPESRGGADSIRIPNVGWRTLETVSANGFLEDLEPGTMTYFVHSYAPVVDDPANVAATIPVNGVDVAAVIQHGAIVGYQFHPEKSGPAGLALIDQFLKLKPPSRG